MNQLQFFYTIDKRIEPKCSTEAESLSQEQKMLSVVEDETNDASKKGKSLTRLSRFHPMYLFFDWIEDRTIARCLTIAVL